MAQALDAAEVSGELRGTIAAAPHLPSNGKPVSEFKDIRVDQVVKSLGIEEKDVLELAKILQEHDIVKLHYTVVGDIVLKKGKKLEVSGGDVDEEIQKIERGSEDTEVDKLLDVIRDRIREKKHGEVKK